MLSTALGICAVLGVVAGIVLRFRQHGKNKSRSACTLVLSIGLLGIACLVGSTQEIKPVDFRHERELMLFRWMSKAAGMLFLGIALVAAAWIGRRRSEA